MKMLIPLAFALQAYEAELEEAVKVTPKTRQDLERFIGKNLRRKDARFFMAFEDDRIAGYASGWLSKANISASGKSYGFICDSYVLESHRGRGIGKRLVTELIQWFNEQDVEYIEVYTYVNNDLGKGFWESEGFRPNMIRYLRKMGKIPK